MAERERPDAIRRVMPVLVALLWLLSLLQQAVSSTVLTWTIIALMSVFVLIAAFLSGWQTRLLCIALATATITIAVTFGGWQAIPTGIAKSAVFVAFLSTIVLLRATADQRPEINAARELFNSLPSDRRGGGILIGANLLGAVLIVGVFALLAPILRPDAEEDERRSVALSALRGMCVAVLWSPFFVATAFSNHYLPGVALWQIMPLGLCLTALALITAYVMFERSGGMIGMWRSLASLSPVMPSVVVAALPITLLSALTPMTTLQSLITSLPILCFVVLYAMGNPKPAAAARATRSGLAGLGPELAIMTFALTLGTVFEASLGATGLLPWLEQLAPPPWAVIAVTIFGTTMAGFFAIHPIVTGTVVLVLFTSFDTGTADIVLMQSMLIAWGLGTMISLGSVSVATSSVMFRLAPQRLISGGNIAYVMIFATMSVFILTGLNRLIAG